MLNFSPEPVRGRHVLAALSGGADSVALLLLLCRARDEGILTLSAAHFDHGIRGAESRADAEFCQALCREKDVPLFLGKGDVPAAAQFLGEGLESCARRLRYDFLNRCAKIAGADYIALAHHQDDQAETVLMHLLRGAGLAGACGMRPLSGLLYRPLLGVSKSEIIAFLQKEGQSWREDSTNQTPDTPRNALRLTLLPEMEKTFPGASRALSRYAANVQADQDLLEKYTDHFLQERARPFYRGWTLHRKGAEPALLRRALLRLCGPETSSETLERLLTLETALDVRKDLRAEAWGEELYLLSPFVPPEEVPLNLSGETVLPGICAVRCAPWPPEPEKVQKEIQVLDPTALTGTVLRTRRQGDRIHPLGMKGTKSLSDYMTDLKIPRPLRDGVPLIARGDTVLWAVGLGVSQDCALKGDAAVRLECKYFTGGCKA